MNIGVLTFKKYDENVLLNANFKVEELINIILNDRDFVRFEIFDNDKNLLASTSYNHVEPQGVFIQPVKMERKEEIKGVDYYAFRTPSTIYKTKIRWQVRGANFRTKKRAVEYADQINRKVMRSLEQFIDRTSF